MNNNQIRLLEHIARVEQLFFFTAADTDDAVLGSIVNELEHAVVLGRKALAARTENTAGDRKMFAVGAAIPGYAELDCHGWVHLHVSAPLDSTRRAPTGYMESTILLLLQRLMEERLVSPSRKNRQ